MHCSSSQLLKRQCRTMVSLQGEIWGVTLAVGFSHLQQLDICRRLAPPPRVLTRQTTDCRVGSLSLCDTGGEITV